MGASVLVKQSEKSLKPQRNSNLELLRIITMLLIVAHHYLVNSGLYGGPSAPVNANITAWRSVFLLLFGFWGKTGINCFVFITGYFMCKSNITLKKFAKLLLEVYFYKLTIYFIFLITKQEAFSVFGFLKQLLPITTLADGFTDCFLVFYLFIPFLNILIKNITKNQHRCLLALLLSVYTVMGSIPGFRVVFNYATWFCVLYFISSYVRLYPNKYSQNTKFWGVCLAVSLFLSAASIICLSRLPFGGAAASYGAYSDRLLDNTNKIFSVIVGFCAFMFFNNIKIKNNQFINSVASTTFGVLLIHGHSDTMRIWLWVKTLKNTEAYFTPYVIIHAVLSVVLVFAVCSVIDYCRIMLIEKPFFDKKWNGVEEKLISVWGKIRSKANE